MTQDCRVGYLPPLRAVLRVAHDRFVAQNGRHRGCAKCKHSECDSEHELHIGTEGTPWFEVRIAR